MANLVKQGKIDALRQGCIVVIDIVFVQPIVSCTDRTVGNEVMKLITASSVLIISNNKNLGVAHALNQIKNSGQCCF